MLVIINVGLKRYKFQKNAIKKLVNIPFCYRVSFSSYENNIVKTMFLPDALIVSNMYDLMLPPDIQGLKSIYIDHNFVTLH